MKTLAAVLQLLDQTGMDDPDNNEGFRQCRICKEDRERARTLSPAQRARKTEWQRRRRAALNSQGRAA